MNPGEAYVCQGAFKTFCTSLFWIDCCQWRGFLSVEFASKAIKASKTVGNNLVPNHRESKLQYLNHHEYAIKEDKELIFNREIFP